MVKLMIVPKHYDLFMSILPDLGEMEAESKVTLVNQGLKPIRFFHVLLNRGLRVNLLKCIENKVSYSQTQAFFPDLKELRVNLIEVSFERPLEPGQVATLVISYSGNIKEYEEVLPYVKDRISREYTIIRTDAFSYPVICPLEIRKMISFIPSQRFTYMIRVMVPRDLTVANLGRLKDTHIDGDKAVFSYVSKLPSWRIDVAVSRFIVVEEGDIKVYAMEKDFLYGKRLINEVRRCLKFYKEWIGVGPPRWVGYTIIELPRGYGGQADVCGMLIDEISFRDPKRIGGIYHELAHLWNVASSEKYPSRFLDEAFATYFQLVAEKHFIGEKEFMEKIAAFRQKFRRMAEKNPEILKTPPAKYGEYMLTDLSYIVGTYILYMLHSVIGDKYFRKLVSNFIEKHRETPATLKDFINVTKEICGTDFGNILDKFFFDNMFVVYLASDRPLKEVMVSLFKSVH